MGITAVEHAQVAPRNPVAGCVVDDRYIVTMAYNSSSSGGTGFTDYAVFDAVTETSSMFSFPVRNIYSDSMVAANGYAWAIGKDYNTNTCNLARVNPTTGGYTIFAVASGMRANAAWIAYANGYFMFGCLNTYDAPHDAWTDYWMNATTMTVLSTTQPGGGYAFNNGTRYKASGQGYGNVLIKKRGSSSGGSINPSHKMVANTGVVTDVTGTSFPGSGVMTGATLISGGTVWDTTTETVTRTIPGGVSGALNQAIGTDGLVYTVSDTTVIAVDIVTGATRTETFPTSRTERTLVFSVNGKLWSPSGYPL